MVGTQRYWDNLQYLHTSGLQQQGFFCKCHSALLPSNSPGRAYRTAPKHNASKQFWCRWRESNPHGGLAQRILSPPRLPVPTHRHTFMNTLLRTLPKKQEGYAGGMLMKLESLYQKSNEFATPFPELGKTDATHFESTSSTNSNTPAGTPTV